MKQHLAAIRMLFDWLVTGQVIPLNPAHAVRGPKHSVKKGKTSVLSAEEMRTLLDSIDTTKLIGLRDRALIALMGYTFARVGAVIQMKVEDYYIQNRRGWVRLHEKGGKVNELPCHHNLEQFLDEWLASVGARGQSRPLPSSLPCGTGSSPAGTPLAQAEVYQMIRRRARGGRHRDEDLLPQLPRDRHHHIFAERRQARSGPADGRPRVRPHDGPLRSAE